MQLSEVQKTAMSDVIAYLLERLAQTKTASAGQMDSEAHDPAEAVKNTESNRSTQQIHDAIEPGLVQLR